MNMQDIMIVCDVVMDPTFEIMVFADIAFILLLIGIAIGVIIYVITRIVKLIKAMKLIRDSNATVSNVENAQTAQTAQNVSDTQKDDIEQMK